MVRGRGDTPDIIEPEPTTAVSEMESTYNYIRALTKHSLHLHNSVWSARNTSQNKYNGMYICIYSTCNNSLCFYLHKWRCCLSSGYTGCANYIMQLKPFDELTKILLLKTLFKNPDSLYLQLPLSTPSPSTTQFLNILFYNGMQHSWLIKDLIHICLFIHFCSV